MLTFKRSVKVRSGRYSEYHFKTTRHIFKGNKSQTKTKIISPYMVDLASSFLTHYNLMFARAPCAQLALQYNFINYTYTLCTQPHTYRYVAIPRWLERCPSRQQYGRECCGVASQAHGQAECLLNLSVTPKM